LRGRIEMQACKRERWGGDAQRYARLLCYAEPSAHRPELVDDGEGDESEDEDEEEEQEMEAVGLGEPLGHLSWSQAVGVVPHRLESSADLVEHPLNVISDHQAGKEQREEGRGERRGRKGQEKLGELMGRKKERREREGGWWKKARVREGLVLHPFHS
jgi:hypothetical protein